MDASEMAVMFGVVLLFLVFISGLMVMTLSQLARLLMLTRLQIGTAWFMGAQFPNIFKEASFVLSKLGNTPAPAVPTGRDEL